MRDESVFRVGIALILLWALLFALLTGGAALTRKRNAAKNEKEPEPFGTDSSGEPDGTSAPSDAETWFLPDWSDFDGKKASAASDPPGPIPPVPEETGALPVSESNPVISVYRSADGNVVSMPLEDYVLCVLSAEMPLSFGAEALKAQAVAIRTVTLYQLSVGREHGETDAFVCDDYRHCMAFFSPEEGLSRFGASYMDSLHEAVDATAGLILTSDGVPIPAMFHSSSHGRTEDAEAVLGTAVPCIVSVTSWEDDRISRVSLPFSSFRALFTARTDLPFDGVSLVRDPSGRVSSLTAFGVTLTGTEFRALAGLASADFEIIPDADTVSVVCHGSGHGVGMSQYGAARMAEFGYSFSEILSHYYPGAGMEAGVAMYFL